MDNRPDIDETIQRIFGDNKNQQRERARSGDFFFTIGGLKTLIYLDDPVMTKTAIDLAKQYFGEGRFSIPQKDRILKEIYVGIQNDHMKGHALDAMSAGALKWLDIRDIVAHTPKGSFLEDKIAHHPGWKISRTDIDAIRLGISLLSDGDLNPHYDLAAELSEPVKPVKANGLDDLAQPISLADHRKAAETSAPEHAESLVAEVAVSR